MLDPSSSEEESDELLEEDRRDVLVVSASGGAGHRTLHAPPRDSRDTTLTRPASPSPSISSEGREEQERAQREERERRSRLQLYVFVMRCIAYPFNAKQPTDMTRRQQKLNKQQLQTIRERFQAFLKGDTQIAADEAFINAVRSYYEGVHILKTPFDEVILTLNAENLKTHLDKTVDIAPKSLTHCASHTI